VIRNLLISAWILCVVLAGTYAGATIPLGSKGKTEHVEEGPMMITLKSMTVPVISGGAMQGYVLVHLTLTLKRDLAKSMPQPPDLVAADYVFRTIYAEEQVDFRNLKKQDLDKVSKNILESFNARAGVPVVENVLLQELHYLSKQEVAVGIGVGGAAGAGGGGAKARH
jgi:hypothetical protein